ncbi:tol-pal system YbgF family protein [Parerythrobacter aestuarii]|uniref:hypothetical protein n=1 Tax=Parerythrobacter aestuarii TaxID=3020909 RepID=UPI0024DECFEE|nr:hypothetical protein [Parerythrobacter aestuarii]
MRKTLLAVATLLGASWAAPALASGDYCEPLWRPENPDLNCAGSIPIAPGNDSRINLFLLLQDRAGNDGAGLAYPDTQWRSFYGRNFMRWNNLYDAWYPDGGESLNFGYGYAGRCQTEESGKTAFLKAVDALRGLKGETRTLLSTSRDRLGEICDRSRREAKLPSDGGYFLNIGANGIGDAPFGFMAYLEASASFYGGNWDRATDYYGLIHAADVDDWLTETSKYMVARTLLNQAIASAEDDWGWFPLAQVDAEVAMRSEKAFSNYLEAYPEGRYAASARGLLRKALWLQRDYARLGATYADAFAAVDPDTPEAARLISEIDDKYLIRNPGKVNDPYLAAANLLLRMRSENYYFAGDDAPEQLTQTELDSQALVFADHPELYGFLKASFAFYVDKDYAVVRELLPDDARQDRYSPLAFSRQYLRGLALHALGDRNEEGFWRELIGGAQGLYQRPAVELALARALEQKGEVGDAFVANSPIRDWRIRRMLLGLSAGPRLLKQQARADGPNNEAAFALFTALFRQLQHGEYAGFLEDYPLAAKYPSDQDSGSLWGVMDAEKAPVYLFRSGEFSAGYACPSLEATAQVLARDPTSSKARLCLGEFYRLNGFDEFEFVRSWYGEDGAGQLGTSTSYPGKVTHRLDLYRAVMADTSAARGDKAYALYRAIRCYAPSNNNTCGGEGVEENVRAAWFRRLKRDYADTAWAKELEYYW